MSRSYKRTPYLRLERKDCRYLNKKVRRQKLEKLPKGGFYRKTRTGDWDWKYIWTKEQAMQDYKSDDKPWIRERYTLEQWMNYWASCVLRK